MSGRLRGYMAFDMKFTDKFNPMQWISHSNSIVSQVMTSEKYNHMIALQDEMELVMTQIHGVPMQRKTMEEEMLITFNMCYLYLLHEKAMPHERIYRCINHTFTRIGIFYEQKVQKTWTKQYKYYGELEDIFSGESVEEYRPLMVLLLCMMYLCSNHTGGVRSSDTLLCAQNIIDAHLKTATNETETSTGYSLCFSNEEEREAVLCDRSKNMSSSILQNVVSFLTAISNYNTQKVENALTCISKINCKRMERPAKCLEIYVLYDLGQYPKCQSLIKKLVQSGNLPSSVMAFLLSMDGSCLANQGKPHTALQRFKAALEADFSFLLPLFNASQQYRKLKLFDAELEALNLFVTALQSQSEEKRERDHQVFDVSEVCWRATMGKAMLRLENALYALACRCLELEKYDVATHKFNQLLKFLQDHRIIGQPNGTESLVILPSIWVIYSKTIYSFLEAGKYEEALVFCDDVLPCSGNVECHPQELFEFKPQRSSCENKISLNLISQQQEEYVKKRARSDNGSTTEIIEASVLIHIYRVKCLAYLSRINEALHCISCCERILESHITNKEGQDTLPKKPQKRARLELELPPVPSAVVDNINAFSGQLGDLYMLKAQLYVGAGELQKALHYTTSAIQHVTDNSSYIYNHCLVLLKLQRSRDMAVEWLSYRGHKTQLNLFQIQRLLSNHEDIKGGRSESSSSSWSRSFTEDDCLNMDFASLNILKKMQT